MIQSIDSYNFLIYLISNVDAAPEPPPRASLSRNNSFIESQRRAEETRSSAGLQQMLLDPSPSPTVGM